MLTKKITSLIIIIFIFSGLLSLVHGQCYTCSDTGKIVCNNCQGSGEIPASDPVDYCEYCRGQGTIRATITKKSGFAYLGYKEVFVSGIFENDEAVGVYASVTAEVMSEISVFSNESERMYFPPNEEITITLSVGEFPDNDWAYISKFGNLETNTYISNSDSLICPSCGGDGILTPMLTCSICGGAGFTDCPDCTTNTLSDGLEGVTIIGIAAIIGLVIGSFFLIKRNKLSEENLRNMSSYEYKNWIIEKFSGKNSDIRDSRVGIDGFSLEGVPIHINQSDSIEKNEIYKFANELSKRRLRRGIIVAFNFDDKAIEGIINARQNLRVFIKNITAKELIDRSNLAI